MNKKFMFAFALLLLSVVILSGCIPRPIPPSDEDEALADEDETALEEETDEEIADKEMTDEETAESEDMKEETTEKEEETKEMKEKAEAGIPTRTVVEGELVDFPNLKATDPDGDPIKYTFASPLDTKGKWQTKVGDAGEYKVKITASDGKNDVSQEVMIVVKAKNKAPVITVSDVSVDEGETVRLEPKVTDADGDKVTVTYSGWMQDDVYTTDFDDEGTHTVTITATDGKNTVTKNVRILVKEVNRAPVFAENAFD